MGTIASGVTVYIKEACLSPGNSLNVYLTSRTTLDVAAGQSSSQPAKQMDLISSRSNLEKIHHENGSLPSVFPCVLL